MFEEKINNKPFNFIFLVLLFLTVLFFSSTYFMSHWWVHALISIFACIQLKKISHYSITWILIANAIFFSNQPRFSVEFLITALGISAWALSDQYLKTNNKQRFLLILFLILSSIVFSFFGKNLNEPFSLLAWLPILISFYTPVTEKMFNKQNLFIYPLSMILIFFSSKKSVILGLCAQFINRLKNLKSLFFLVLVSAIIFFTSFLVQDDLNFFVQKSISPRFIIWQSAIEGFIHKPFTGNGFGLFPIEVNGYRDRVSKIGGRINDHLNHAHNNFLHFAFEQGFFGLALFSLFLWFLFLKHRNSFWTVVVLSFLDANLVYNNQFFIAALIFLPEITTSSWYPSFIDTKYFYLPKKYQDFAFKLLLLCSIIFLGFSVVGHYYYDQKKYEMAIKFDADHPMYHFFQAIKLLKKNSFENAIPHLEKSIELANNHGYQQGFLAMAYYMNNQTQMAQALVEDAMRLSGEQAHWKYVAGILYENKDKYYSTQLKKEACELDPIFEYYQKGLKPPSYNSIGGNLHQQFWINSYQRRAEKVYLPTPQY